MAAMAAAALVIGAVVVKRHYSMTMQESLKELDTRCMVAVQRASLVIWDAIRDGHSVEDAWEASSRRLRELAGTATLQPCPCWRSRWIINPAAPRWSDAEIAADPLLAAAAFNWRAGAEVHVVLVTAGGSMEVARIEDLPEWATDVPIEAVE